MEKTIRSSINDEIINQAVLIYGGKFADVFFVGGFENCVYELALNKEPFILRLVHSNHREYNDVLAEIEFIDYLSNNQASVSQVIKTRANKLAETIKIDDGNYFTVTLFTKADGDFVVLKDRTPDFFRNFGEVVGKFHKLTKSYQPIHKRGQWYEEKHLAQLKVVLPEEDMFIYDKFKALIEEIKALPTDLDSYGLIHTDLHFKNMFYESNKLTIFDWDDTSYKHFISDIAVIIFYMYVYKYNLDNDKKGDYTYQFLRHFFEGYLSVNKLDYTWFDHLLKFLKLREFVLYSVIMQESDEFRNTDGAKKFLSFYKERIRNDIPFLNIKRALGDNRKKTQINRGV
ncbi:MAG: phosphotransferase [Candidatus Izemoplasma sp.]